MIAVTLESVKSLRRFCIKLNKPNADKFSVQTLSLSEMSAEGSISVMSEISSVVKFKVVNLLQAKTEMASSSMDDAFNTINKCKRAPYMEIVWLINCLSLWLGKFRW